MSRSAAFWDASALTPLCVGQLTSAAAKTEFAKFMPVVWWATPVEVHSAISRLQRTGLLNDAGRKIALQQLEGLRGDWHLILPTNELRELAERLLDRYVLRAADSLQLAAAMTWCHRRPAGRSFVCQDVRLCEAAGDAGFHVVQL